MCVCVWGEGFPHISCAFCPAPPDLDPLFPYNNKGAFLSSHYPTTTTALLRSSFNTRKYQQCVEILCFNELLKWKCCYKNIQWEEEVSPLFTSFPQKTKKRFQCSVEGLRMRSLGHLAGADEKGLWYHTFDNHPNGTELPRKKAIILNWFCFLFFKSQETKIAPGTKQDRRAGGW